MLASVAPCITVMLIYNALLLRIPDAGQIETLIQEADELFSAENIDDNKLKVHKLLEEATQEVLNIILMKCKDCWN